MDEVDFRHELCANMRGNKVYPSKKDLERESPCTKECGIVLVEVRFIRQVRKDKFDKYLEEYAKEMLKNEGKQKSILKPQKPLAKVVQSRANKKI